MSELWKELHDRVEKIDKKVDENTKITTDNKDKIDEMYAAFLVGKNGLRMVAATGNGFMWVADKAGKLAKPLLFVFLATAAVTTYIKTGRVPEWLIKLLG